MSQTDYDAAMTALEHWKDKALAAESRLRACERFGIQTDVSPMDDSVSTNIPLSNIDGGASLPTPRVGVKFDDAKPRMDLVPVSAIRALADVLTMGATKYGDRNWEKGLAWGRVYGATMRHLLAWWHGEDLDAESGLCHLKHALCNVAFLVEYVERATGTDDRPGKERA